MKLFLIPTVGPSLFNHLKKTVFYDKHIYLLQLNGKFLAARCLDLNHSPEHMRHLTNNERAINTC